MSPPSCKGSAEMLARVDAVEAGRLAWSRLREHQRVAWGDWRDVGLALKVGRDAAMSSTGAKSPHGKKYTSVFGAWMRANGFGDVSQQVRNSLMRCIEDLDAIEQWRAGLDEEQRRRYNHPDSVLMNFRRRAEPARGPTPRRAIERRAPPPSASRGPGRGGRAVHWNSDAIRRGAQAYRECMSRDIFTIVRAVLEGAVRCEADLLQLLEQPTARSQPRPAAVAATLEQLHA